MRRSWKQNGEWAKRRMGDGQRLPGRKSLRAEFFVLPIKEISRGAASPIRRIALGS
jgi:hypothetical protein